MERKIACFFSFLGGGIFAVIVILSGIYLILSSGVIDPGADQPIPDIERWMAKTSIRAYLKGHTPQTKNPLPVNNENLSNGCKLYVNNCAVCHGLADGKKSKISEGFNKSAPIFVNEAEEWSKDPDGLIYWFIEHGVRLTAMPAYSKSMTETEKWQVVMFIKEMYKLPEPVKSRWQGIKTVDVMN
ncbi:MAG: cytochrome c [Candidatus Obscuribacterales bacterium]|nr:cytochrome c [Candidatus Obscuribacterales bacterium]